MNKDTHQNGMEHGHNIPVFAIAEGVLALLKTQPIRSGLQTADIICSYNDILNPGDVLGKLQMALSKMAIPRSAVPLDPNADHPVLASALASDEATGTQVRVDILQGPYSSQRRVQVFVVRVESQPKPISIDGVGTVGTVGDATELIPPGTIAHPGASK